MMSNDGISVADALALRNSGNDNSDMWGGNGAWWVIILILFGLGGWGRGGYGNYGGNDGGANGMGYFYNPCCTPATAQGVSDAFNFSQLDNGVRAISNGLCDGFYSTLNALQDCCCKTQTGMLQGFNGVQQSIANLGFQTSQGFCGVDKSILQASYQNQAGFNSLANQLASCCCDIERGHDSIKTALATAANSILVANDRNTDRIINHLTQTEMDALRTELQSAQFQLSQNAQTNNLVNQLMPVAKPAYITCSPYASAFGFYGQTGYNGCGGCGCNCGCA